MTSYIALTRGGTEERWRLDEGLYERYFEGSLIERRDFNADDATLRGVVRALTAMETQPLLPRLRAALTTNRAYLDKVNAGTATNADHIGQVPALTRQMNAVLLRAVLTVDDGGGGA